MLHILLYAYFQLYVLNIYIYTFVQHLSNKMLQWVLNLDFFTTSWRPWKAARSVFDASAYKNQELFTCISVYQRKFSLSPEMHWSVRLGRRYPHGFWAQWAIGCVVCEWFVCVPPNEASAANLDSPEALATAAQWQQETGRATNTGTQYTRDTEQTRGVMRGESHVH